MRIMDVRPRRILPRVAFQGHRGTIRCRFHALPQPVENKVLHSPLHRPLHWAYMGFYTGRYIAPPISVPA